MKPSMRALAPISSTDIRAEPEEIGSLLRADDRLNHLRGSRLPPTAAKQVHVRGHGIGQRPRFACRVEFPFAKIVGIELSEHLHRIAEENIKRYKPASQQCAAFDLHCMDALDYSYADEPFVLFLFDQLGREILEKIIANLEASLKARPREAYVVYVYPQYEDVLQNSSVLHRVAVGGLRWRPWS